MHRGAPVDKEVGNVRIRTARPAPNCLLGGMCSIELPLQSDTCPRQLSRAVLPLAHLLRLAHGAVTIQ